jgi:hypothetical protein
MSASRDVDPNAPMTHVLYLTERVALFHCPSNHSPGGLDGVRDKHGVSIPCLPDDGSHGFLTSSH